MAKSYFAILGVTSGAPPDEIRSAYRRLAKEYHPDHFEGGSGPFREIQEAYSVLGNAQRRREYEQSIGSIPIRRYARNISRPAPEPLVREQGPVDIVEISPVRSFQTFRPSFDEIFGWLWDNFSSIDWPKSGRVQNLTLEVPLTRDQALRGGNAKVMVPVRVTCPICRGTGGVGYYECSRCTGKGAISGEMPIAIPFPSGLRKDHAVVVPLDRFGIRNLHLTVLFRITYS
jgi:DnaJ-class molecular chaperone